MSRLAVDIDGLVKRRSIEAAAKWVARHNRRHPDRRVYPRGFTSACLTTSHSVWPKECVIVINDHDTGDEDAHQEMQSYHPEAVTKFFDDSTGTWRERRWVRSP